MRRGHVWGCMLYIWRRKVIKACESLLHCMASLITFVFTELKKKGSEWSLNSLRQHESHPSYCVLSLKAKYWIRLEPIAGLCLLNRDGGAVLSMVSTDSFMGWTVSPPWWETADITVSCLNYPSLVSVRNSQFMCFPCFLVGLLQYQTLGWPRCCLFIAVCVYKAVRCLFSVCSCAKSITVLTFYFLDAFFSCNISYHANSWGSRASSLLNGCSHLLFLWVLNTEIDLFLSLLKHHWTACTFLGGGGRSLSLVLGG